VVKRFQKEGAGLRPAPNRQRLSQWLPPRKPGVQLMPVGYAWFAETPAQVYHPTVTFGREIDQSGADVFDLDAQVLNHLHVALYRFEVGKHRSGFFAAAIADCFFEHRP
ncbi:MAG: hypothetical protein AAB382_12575, partial [Chloroflexota bacterium]